MSTLIGVDDTPEPTSLKPSLIEPTSAHEETVIEPDTPEAAPTGQEPAPANYQFADDWTTHGTENFKPGSDTVDYPSGDRSRIQTMLSDIPAGMTTRDAQSATWLDALRGGMEALHPDTTQEGLSHREGAEWLQAIPSPVGPLRAGTPRLVTPDAGGVYSGDKARLMLRDSMKLGTTFTVPLWHSGFWVTLRAPSEGPLLELLRTITQDKISLGRATYGLLYSNMMVYTQRHLLDFIVEHVYETSLAVANMSELRQHIQLADLSVLVWGLACATWPHGFQYRRACISDPEKCHHVVEERLSLSRLLAQDKTALSDRQIQHMTNRQRGKMTLDKVELYRSDFILGKAKLIQIVDGLSMEMTMPLAQDYIDSGTRWVMDIEDNYGRIMGQDETARDTYLLDQARASDMRQYAHLVTAIEVEGRGRIEDRETIEGSLADLSGRDDIRLAFLKKVSEYLDSSLVAFVAIPNYQCPACNGWQRPQDDTSASHLIPIDVYQTFFRLLVQRQERVQNRTIIT